MIEIVLLGRVNW